MVDLAVLVGAMIVFVVAARAILATHKSASQATGRDAFLDDGYRDRVARFSELSVAGLARRHGYAYSACFFAVFFGFALIDLGTGVLLLVAIGLAACWSTMEVRLARDAGERDLDRRSISLDSVERTRIRFQFRCLYFLEWSGYLVSLAFAALLLRDVLT